MKQVKEWPLHDTTQRASPYKLKLTKMNHI